MASTMCAPSSAPAPLLRVPPEIRREIFLALFRSTSIRSGEHRHINIYNSLAVLSVCRLFYQEASPLAIPNIHVFCHSNAALIKTLSRMSPAQITQLRHLTVYPVPVGFKLFRKVGSARGDAADGDGQEPWDAPAGDDPSLYGRIPKHVRYFHLGAVLGLFPGLQLNLLEVDLENSRDGVDPRHNPDCLASLLEANGYRELRMVAAHGGFGEWYHVEMPPSMRSWMGLVERRFKPHGGEVRFLLLDHEWRQRDAEPFWVAARDAGIVLAKSQGGEDAGEYASGEVPIVAKRGDGADIVVKRDDARVLRCIGRQDRGEPETFFEDASEALRKLFREKSWGHIQNMDGFDNGYEFGFDVYYEYSYNNYDN